MGKSVVLTIISENMKNNSVIKGGVFKSIAFAVIAIVAGSCSTQPYYDSNCRDIAACTRQAATGNADAALALGDYYSSKRNPAEAIHWWRLAADFGNPKAMRKVFDAYYFGRDAPKNFEDADKYLLRAADSGADWAELIIATRSEKTDADKAMELYRRVATRDNCHAQARLALAYFNGDIVQRNLTQAYFWILLSKAGGSLRKSDNHLLAVSGNRLLSDESLCFHSVNELFGPATKVESSLPQEVLRDAQQAAGKWKRGQQEPTLAAAAVTDTIVSNVQPKQPPKSPSPPAVSPRQNTPERLPSVGSRLPTWIPLAAVNGISGKNETRSPADIFNLASKSVWIVVAARSESDLRTRRNVAQGSAVAVTRTRLFTNCHIIENRPLIWVKKGDVIEQATVASADTESDRCILSLEKQILTGPVGFRPYNELKIGEEVYTIGSPSGLETTLGQGIVSGLRQFRGQRLVQTTAQISPGSSGGGLFDKSANLIGITTFKLGDSEGLNFAITADDYFR